MNKGWRTCVQGGRIKDNVEAHWSLVNGGRGPDGLLKFSMIWQLAIGLWPFGKLEILIVKTPTVPCMPQFLVSVETRG